jgi:RNA polymerase sigma-70 factor, ECF subfamily
MHDGEGERWREARRVCLAVARRYFSADAGEAEDVAQDALIRAWRREGRLRAEDRRRQWLSAITRNEALRHLERRRSEPTDVQSQAHSNDEAMDRAPQRVDLSIALARLAHEDRILLRLRYEEDLTQAAIAIALDMPEGTVKVRLHRAREKLRRILG